MLEQEKIEKLTASFRQRLEKMNANGELDTDRGLSEVIDSFMQESSDFQTEAIEEICGTYDGKKKPVTSAEIRSAILASVGLQ